MTSFSGWDLRGQEKPFSRGDGSSSFKKAKYKNYFNSSSGGSWRKLGLLPGDLKEKVDPYLRPVYDALYQIFGMDHTNRLMERGVIEIAPLAYMRGRTLDDAFVILDEAQNTTVAQMKMFLTRLGFSSKMIVNGDTSQIDLPRGVTSGLVNAERTLKDIEKIAFVNFEASDVVRHPVVAQIIQAYEKNNKSIPKQLGKE